MPPQFYIDLLEVGKFINSLLASRREQKEKKAKEFWELAKSYAEAGHPEPFKVAEQFNPAGAQALKELWNVDLPRVPVREQVIPETRIPGARLPIEESALFRGLVKESPELFGRITPESAEIVPETRISPVYTLKTRPPTTREIVSSYISSLITGRPFEPKRRLVRETVWPAEFPVGLERKAEMLKAEAFLGLDPNAIRRLIGIDIEKIEFEKDKLRAIQREKQEEREAKMIDALTKNYDYSGLPMELPKVHANILLNKGISPNWVESLPEDSLKEQTKDHWSYFVFPKKKVETEKLQTDLDKLSHTLHGKVYRELTPEQQKDVLEHYRSLQRMKEKPQLQLIRHKDTGEEKYIEIKPDLEIPSGWEAVKTPAVSIQMEKVPESIRSAFLEAKKGESIVDQLEKMWFSLPHYEGLVGRVHGYMIDWASKTGIAPEARAYQQFVNGTLAPLVRSLGEKGALTDDDIVRALNLVPRYPDTAKEAMLKLRALREMIRMGFENIKEAAILTPESLKKSVETERFKIIEVK